MRRGGARQAALITKFDKGVENRILRALPLKCAVRIFRTSEATRANEGGKRGVVTTLS